MENIKDKEKKGEAMFEENKERYINPYTDFGFKKLFGTELNKDLLISFLNALFGDELEVKTVTYLNNEHLGDGYNNRKAVFDVYCELNNGKKLIVEMQKAEQENFKDRSVYYAAAPIREQAPRGKWDYHLEGVYTIGILNFVFPDKEYLGNSYIHEVKLTDIDDGHVFYDKLTFIYLEMPKFNKREDELVTMFDKWMFALRNLSRLLDRPKALQERIFSRLFEQAEIARFTPEERHQYEESRKEYWDTYSILTTAENKGRAEGRAEGLAEGREEGRTDERLTIARNLKGMNLPTADIAKATGLTAEEIDKL